MRKKTPLKFTKMHGLGNDFIVIDDLSGRGFSARMLKGDPSRKLCDRRFGVGADQILVIGRASHKNADARMDILNADGSVAEMCGNGIRAVALYLKQHIFKRSRSLCIETLAGLKDVVFSGSSSHPMISVDMGKPILSDDCTKGGAALDLLHAGVAYLPGVMFFEVNIGNPHAVVFVNSVNNYPVDQVGPAIENHPRFPARTNVEFVEVNGPKSIIVRVWERGAGLTLACGSGACASAVAALCSGRVRGPSVNVNLPGGKLVIRWPGPGSSITMTGPAEEVFLGVVSKSGEYF
ncbi:MAG: diaminopimelate epimerase [Bdellovibrionota bacterium]|mgnify:FL=1